ncbi:SDR family NAD(P)-dependent oxidoreductase [Sporichthya sp.]|uniref:SDR family NAD(P)-dependent oxidoreductase n=1 Tax=Sporichthya sp. TaxID=65475 RepID=UPI00183C31F5|nr:SDR family NAD(P)-dependent oxidoreductase [Sporichthya sp.]MBA3744790.1 SDR family oxidoreductase [Sporichthya sp.]
MTPDLTGRTVIVTGAGSGIGKAVAIQAAVIGANVVVTDIKGQDETAAEIGAAAEAHELDVTDAGAWSRVVEAVVASRGGVYGLVNNAGIASATDSLAVQTEEGWDAMIGVDLKGVWLGMRAVLAPMLAAGEGSIVNVASVAGLIGVSDVLAYSAAKGGVIAMTRQVSIQHAKDQIRVNAVCPGVTQTPILGDISDELLAAISNITPMGRLGQPDDIAGLTSYLLSPASAFLTGQAIAICGGFSVQ